MNKTGNTVANWGDTPQTVEGKNLSLTLALVDSPSTERKFVQALDGTNWEQITTPSSRWYRSVDDPSVILPSNTYKIGVAYPTPPQLIAWKQYKGAEADDIMTEAADEGRNIHEAIYDLLQGRSVLLANYNAKEARCLSAWIKWAEKAQPTFILGERVIYSKRLNVAATVDFLGLINGELTLIDWKSSKAAYETHKIEVATQKAVLMDMYPELDPKMMILPLSANTNGGYSENMVTDDWLEWPVMLDPIFRKLVREFKEPEQYPERFKLDIPTLEFESLIGGKENV